MLEKYFRVKIQRQYVDGIAFSISKRISANQMTFLAGIFGFLVLPLLFLHHIFFACICLLCSGFCDMLDGTIARVEQTAS